MYKGIHRKPFPIDLNWNRPIIHAELHAGVYIVLLLGIIFH